MKQQRRKDGHVIECRWIEKRIDEWRWKTQKKYKEKRRRQKEHEKQVKKKEHLEGRRKEEGKEEKEEEEGG